MRIFLFFILASINYLINAQNIVSNGDFEEVRSKYISTTHYAVNIDSFTTHWRALFGAPSYYNDTVPSVFNGLTRPLMPKAFRNHAYGFLHPNYTTYDTLNNSITYYIDTTGGLPGFYTFWGLYNSNSGIYQKLKYSLTIDTTYIVSYRLKIGSEITPKGIVYSNFMNNYGVLFTTKDISKQKKYRIDYYKPELQDTILDTSYRWRLIKNEFKADSAYEYVNFAQFLDLQTVRYKVKFAQKYNLGGRFNIVDFILLMDDVRLLPRWQYLEVTPDVYACEGDSVELKVLSGAGGYQWIETNQPNTILSTTNTLKVKLADTNIKYQVMSPYDTAVIPIYVTKNTYIYDTINYSTCENKALKVSTPNIFRWYDNTKDTTKTFTTTGNYWYETKTNCDVKKTQINIKIGISKYDTIKQTSCDTFTYKNNTYKNSGFYTFPYKSIQNCDSFQTLNLTINQSKKITLNHFSCSSYKWLDSSYSAIGVYARQFKTINQCDSIVSLNLKIGLNDKINLTNGINFTSQQDSVSYQWYRCNPWRRITNETKRTFTTKTRGSYAVVLDNGKGCRDTSDCIELYSSALINPAQAGVSMWSVFPNPFSDELIIDLGKEYKEVSVKMYDLTGRVISIQVVKNYSTLKINNSKLPSGVYYLQIETESQNQFFNIRKE